MDMFVRKHLGGHSFDQAHQKHRAKFKHKRKELFDWQSCSLLFSCCWLGKNLKKPLGLLLSVDTWWPKMKEKCQQVTDNKTTTNAQGKLAVVKAAEDDESSDDDDDWMQFGALRHNSSAPVGKLAAVKASSHSWAGFGALRHGS